MHAPPYPISLCTTEVGDTGLGVPCATPNSADRSLKPDPTRTTAALSWSIDYNFLTLTAAAVLNVPDVPDVPDCT